MAVQLSVNIEDQDFINKLTDCIQKNPNIMRAVLAKAMEAFAKIGPDAALNGGQGLRVRTGKTYRAGFKAYRKSSKKYSMGIYTARIANIFQGQKNGNLPTIKIMKIAEKAFRQSGVLQQILADEMERVYNG